MISEARNNDNTKRSPSVSGEVSAIARRRPSIESLSPQARRADAWEARRHTAAGRTPPGDRLELPPQQVARHTRRRVTGLPACLCLAPYRFPCCREATKC